MRSALIRTFAPTVLEIQDDSALHEGHAGAHPRGQTHYSVLIVSSAFEGVSRVARSRAVHSALQSEFGEQAEGSLHALHALALTLRTPAEHEAATRR